jgi:hypothetical protein
MLQWLGSQRLRYSERWEVTLAKKEAEYDRNNYRWPWECPQGDRAASECGNLGQLAQRYHSAPPAGVAV